MSAEILYVLPDSCGSPACRAFSEMLRLISFSLNTSSAALTRSSVSACRVTAFSPAHATEAFVPRKSNRVDSSLAVWLRALSTSCRSTLETMSNDGSLTAQSSPHAARRRVAGSTPRWVTATAYGSDHHPPPPPTHPGLPPPSPHPVSSLVPGPQNPRTPAPPHGRLPERPKGAVCKTVGSAFVGSNPTPATSTNHRSGPVFRKDRA